MLKEKNLQYDDDVINSKLQNIDIDTFSMSNNYYQYDVMKSNPRSGNRSVLESSWAESIRLGAWFLEAPRGSEAAHPLPPFNNSFKSFNKKSWFELSMIGLMEFEF